jgi:subtilisin family serine protease
MELSRYAALVGFIDRLMVAEAESTIRELAELAYQLGPPTADTDTEPEEARRNLTEKEINLLLDLYERAKRLMIPVDDTGAHDFNGVFLISLNRPAALTLFESRATVKADAAQRVFDINTTGICFAVIDGGIDATHPAFLKLSDDSVKEPSKAADGKPLGKDECLKRSRVAKTYDFTILRDVIAHAGDPLQADGPNGAAVRALANNPKYKEAFSHLTIRSNSARDLDWEIVRPLIEVQHNPASDAEPYRWPGTDHGTHVAGILAANLPLDEESDRPLVGICPHLTLYDLRVFDAEGRGDEFAILCALEFVGWLNRDRANPVVHGVNLSLALAHDVDSFACGQTPICEACNHLVGAGTIVVAAAGNTGFEGGAEKQSIGNGYRAISITDPGNADKVITVGSTHRRDPHLYGVSYFSARGPTGDGRRKPDILAPGEKITSTIRDGRSQRMDGTSMAAPHVAGAAALLMARYPELIGRPLQIKEILMRTATDLNREHSFQGAGLVDVLRALQSV